MAEFDAGSIVAELDVDRRPFTRGLDEARRQADEFGQRGHTTTLDVDTRVAAAELDNFERRLRELNRHATVHIDIDTRVAAEELRLFEERLREALRQRTVDIRTNNTGTPGGNGPRGGSSSGGDGGGGIGLWGALIPLIASALPAIVPLLLAASGATAALAGGFTAALITLGSFAVVAKSDFTDLSAAIKAANGDISKIPAYMQPAATALAQLKFSFASLKAQTAGSVFGAITQGILTLKSVIPTLVPIVNSTARGVSMGFAVFRNFLTGPDFKNFANLAGKEVGPALTSIAVILANIGNAALRMFQIFNPILIRMGKAAVEISGKIADWSRNGGLDDFAKKVYASIGPVLTFLKAFGGALATIWHALASGGGSSLTFLTSIFTAIKQLGPALTGIVQLLTPLELFFVKALPVLVPFVNLLGQLATAAVPLLTATVTALVTGLSGVIKVLTPIVNALTEFFNKIAPANKVLGAIAAGIIGVVVAFKVLRAVLATDPIILALLAIAAVVVVIVDHWQGFKNFWIGLWHDVSRYFTTAWRDIVGAWNAAGRFFQRIWNDVYGFFKRYGALILAVIAPFIGLPLLIAQHWRQIVGWLSKVWSDVSRDVSHWWGDIIHFFEKIPGWITGVFASAGKWLLHAGMDIITGLWTGIKVVWATVLGFYAKVYGVILNFFASAATWLIHAGMSIITGLWNGIRTIWATVLGFYRSVYGTILGFFGNAISWLVGAGSSIITGMAHGLLSAWDAVINWFESLFFKISDVFSEAGSWLIEAGKAIITGLWNGLRQVWNDLTGWIGGIGGWIKSHKGPIEVDRVLLLDEGRAIMLGLHRGMRETFEGVVAPYISGVAGDIQSAFGGTLNGATLATNGSIVSRATLAVSAEQARSTQMLTDRMDALTKAVAAIPDATGKAVGDNVGNIDKATAKQTRDLVTAGRQA